MIMSMYIIIIYYIYTIINIQYNIYNNVNTNIDIICEIVLKVSPF